MKTCILSTAVACVIVLSGAMAFAVAPSAGARVVWTGAGADANWTTAENWSSENVPGEHDDVVLDGTSAKPSVYNAKSGQGREAMGLPVHSITITPDYQGTFTIASPGRIQGSVVLAGKVKVEYDPHVSFAVMGPALDLSGVREFQLRFACGGIALASAEGVQTLTPPPAGICAPEITKSAGGTLRLAGALDAWALFVEPESALDLNGFDVTAKLLQIGGPIKNLGGRTITVSCAVGYTVNAIGVTRHGGDAKQEINLAPAEPWKLVVKKDKLLVLYGQREEWEFHLQHCKIGNCDASQSAVPVWAEKGASDAGGNQGIEFRPQKRSAASVATETSSP